jgi:hypothetical protein
MVIMVIMVIMMIMVMVIELVSCFFSRKCHGLRIFQYMMAGKANISGEEK